MYIDGIIINEGRFKDKRNKYSLHLEQKKNIKSAETQQTYCKQEENH